MSDHEYLQRVREWLRAELGSAEFGAAGPVNAVGLDDEGELDLSALIPFPRASGENSYG